MYNLIKYSDNYYKTSGTSWKYCRDVPAVNDDTKVLILLKLMLLLITLILK